MESRIPNGMIFILSDKCKILSSYYLQSVQFEVLLNIYFWIIAVFLPSSDDQVELKLLRRQDQLHAEQARYDTILNKSFIFHFYFVPEYNRIMHT